MTTSARHQSAAEVPPPAQEVARFHTVAAGVRRVREGTRTPDPLVHSQVL
jgi:hypothetical protein